MISFKGKTILVVDDEPGYREVIGDEFRMLEATVLEADNGAKALSIAKSNKIDSVVSDINMPGGNGIFLLDKIKEIDANFPIVVMVSGFSEYSQEEIYDKGADAQFSKPVNLEHLTKTVHSAMLPETERWVRQLEHQPSDLQLEIKADSLREAIQARVINIGRGGMFVAIDTAPPANETRVSFCLSSPSTPNKIFEGIGICRWIRTGTDSGLPRGMGIEFQNLTEESLQTLLEILQTLKPKAFIPKNL